MTSLPGKRAWWPGSQWVVPSPPITIPTGFKWRTPNYFGVDSRAIALSQYFCPTEKLGSGSFYLGTFHDHRGNSLVGDAPRGPSSPRHPDRSRGSSPHERRSGDALSRRPFAHCSRRRGAACSLLPCRGHPDPSARPASRRCCPSAVRRPSEYWLPSCSERASSLLVPPSLLGSPCRSCSGPRRPDPARPDTFR